MRTETKTTMIGGFVVTALALCTVAVFVFGSGDFLKKTYDYVLFFEDSIKGLSKGAPVTFRGVQIGVVKEIRLVADAERMTTYIPVIIEVNPSSWSTAGSDETKAGKNNMDRLIKKGLRAKLDLQSVVTGKYQIAFDFFPNEPAHYKGVMPDMIEIPTIRGKLNKLADSLENFHFDQLFNSIFSAVDSVNRILNSKEIADLIPAIGRTVDQIELLAGNTNQEVVKLGQQLEGTIAEYKTLARNADARFGDLTGDYRSLAHTLTDEIKPLSADIREAANNISQGVKSAQDLVKKADGTLDKDSPVMTELTQALKELSLAARSIRVWADYLERHPEAFIRGKGEYRR